MKLFILIFIFAFFISKNTPAFKTESPKPENIDDMPCEGSGTMLLQDPRPSISYPYSNKAIAFEPSVGKTVFHPAYVWHESNNYEGEGIRCAVVINFRVLTRNNTDLVKPLVEA